ncbi:MAG: hypothetical protein ACXV8O_08985 [Methylobacter sp.]
MISLFGVILARLPNKAGKMIVFDKYPISGVDFSRFCDVLLSFYIIVAVFKKLSFFLSRKAMPFSKKRQKLKLKNYSFI